MSRAKINDEMATRCELALMGKVVECNNSEVNEMTKYILSALGKADEFKDLDMLKDRICKYSKENEVKYLVCNTLLDCMKCITFLIDTNIEGEPKPFEEDYGTGSPCSFCYVFNTDDDDMCSEFGDCFFRKKSDGFYHRVS